jgi:hypothetical protein
MKNNHPPRSFFLVLVILLMAAGIVVLGLLANSFINDIHNTLNPLEQTNHALSTQVAGLLHPTPTVIPDPVTIIHEIKSIARLETIRYSVEKVISAEINHGILDPLLGDKLLFVAHGYVIAGIDMSKIEAGDLTLQGDVLNVRLPEAEVFVSTLDNDKSYVYSRETGIFARPDPNLETQARQVAEEEILKGAVEDGILDLASTNAQTYLRWFFETLGYKQVYFVPPGS